MSKSIIFLVKSFWATFIDIWRFFLVTLLKMQIQLKKGVLSSKWIQSCSIKSKSQFKCRSKARQLLRVLAKVTFIKTHCFFVGKLSQVRFLVYLQLRVRDFIVKQDGAREEKYLKVLFSFNRPLVYLTCTKSCVFNANN